MLQIDDEPLLASLREHEGFSATVYRCPAGYLTIGYGLNLEAGITREEAEVLLRMRVEQILDRITRTYPWFAGLTEPRQRAIVEMAYQLGFGGLHGFRRMRAALEAGDWPQAAEEMLASEWHEQTPRRAQHSAELMRTG
jgi:lysozyme